MILPAHHLRGHVTGCSTSITTIIRFQLSGNSEVSDAEIALRVQDQVFRFDIPMDHFMFMQKLQSNQYISNKKFGLSLIEISSITNMVSKISAIEVVHDEVEMLPILK